MNDPGAKLDAALARLEALKPYQDTGRDPDTLRAAWEKAWADMVAAAKEYLGSRTGSSTGSPSSEPC
ncbi:MAG: hypothetical protein ACLP1X_00380 [Polyangiaceae bacterium]